MKLKDGTMKKQEKREKKFKKLNKQNNSKHSKHRKQMKGSKQTGKLWKHRGDIKEINNRQNWKIEKKKCKREKLNNFRKTNNIMRE